MRMVDTIKKIVRLGGGHLLRKRQWIIASLTGLPQERILNTMVATR